MKYILTERQINFLKEQNQKPNVDERKLIRGFSSFPENKGYKSMISRDGDYLKVFPHKGEKELEDIFISKMKRSIPDLKNFGNNENFECFVKRKGDVLLVTCPTGSGFKNKRTLAFQTTVEL